MGGKRFESSYYPHRAKWYSGLLTRGDRVRRHFAFPRLRIGELGPWHLLAAFFIPGAGVYIRTPGRIAALGIGLGFVLGVLFFAFLGRPPATLILGSLLSLHCMGIVYMCQPLMAGKRLQYRLLLPLLTLAALGCFLYLPGRDILQRQLLIPLKVHGRVIIFQRLSATTGVRRGDLVAYWMEGTGGSHEGFIVREGNAVGRVLAKEGDVVQFDEEFYLVNGVPYPRLKNMPGGGSVEIPKRTWFIWPDMNIGYHGNVSLAGLPGVMMQSAMVSEKDYLGRAFKRWFFWRQEW